MDENLTEAIEKGVFSVCKDDSIRDKILSDEYDWDKNEVMKIWAFGR